MTVSRYRMRSLAGAISLLLLMVLPAMGAQARSQSAATQTTLDFWYSWTSAKPVQAVVKLFQARYPNIKINATHVPVTGSDIESNQKLFTAIAGGRPPDVTDLDITMVVPFAVRNGLIPLDANVANAKIKATDYFPMAWPPTQWQGHTYGLPTTVLPIGLLYWNKDIFKAAGLDPEKPPTTIAQLDSVMQKLTIKKNGQYTQFGLVPWYAIGYYLPAWAVPFGGSFYNGTTRKITADDAGVLNALQWEVGWAKKLDVATVDRYVASQRTSLQDLFFAGKMAMEVTGIWNINSLRQYVPKMHWGVASVPSPTGRKSLYASAHYLSIPRGAQHLEEAFQFIRFISQDKAAAAALAKGDGAVPANVAAAQDAAFTADPATHTAASLLSVASAFPTLPIGDQYWNSLARQVDQAVHLKMSPQAALSGVSSQMQAQLNPYID